MHSMVNGRNNSFPISEISGPTIVSEGPSAGRRASIVRLGLCAGSCQWCDAAHVWDFNRFRQPRRLTYMTAQQINLTLLTHQTGLTVISGGEPLLQQKFGLADLVKRHAYKRVEIDTNGTLIPDEDLTPLVSVFNVAVYSGVGGSMRYKPLALAGLRATQKAVFKFMAARRADLWDIQKVVDENLLDPVWIMPAGETPEQLDKVLGDIADDVVARGWNLSTRLHVAAWGDRRELKK